VKVWLLMSDRRVEKKRTSVMKRTLNPHFDETLVFALDFRQVRHASLSVHVMDFDRIGPNEEIGRVLLGPRSGPNEVKHWNAMLTKVKTPVTRWHVLREAQ